MNRFVVVLVIYFYTANAKEEFACEGQAMTLLCGPNQTLLINDASYGRNHTAYARECRTPPDPQCSMKVWYKMNKLCTGRRKCEIVVNQHTFKRDPCGYKEFLQVFYTCVNDTQIHKTCEGRGSPALMRKGYIQSYNYPNAYGTGTQCFWLITVQKRQTIKIIIHDFVVGIKRGDKCNDYIRIVDRATREVVFHDCGEMGKKTIRVSNYEAEIVFHSAPDSMPRRGFFISYEGVGPGCEDLIVPESGKVEYQFEENGNFIANVSCKPGYYLNYGTRVQSMKLRCSESQWNQRPPRICSLPNAPTINTGVYTAETPTPGATHDLMRSSSIIGIALGVISAMLLICLLLVLALYIHRSWVTRHYITPTEFSRRSAERKLDQWRFVINNLQDSNVSDATGNDVTLQQIESSLLKHSADAMKKANRKKGSEIDDVLGRNLLMDDLESLDNRDNEMRRPRLGKLSRGSKDTYLEDYDFEPRYRTPQTPARHKRARSGVWERSMMSTDSLVNSLSGSRKITVSAPDLVHLGVQLTPAQRQAINRSTTLALLRGTSRANSKGKIHSIRC